MVTHVEDTAENAYKEGFEAGQMTYWVPTDWVCSEYADKFWEGYEEGLKVNSV